MQMFEQLKVAFNMHYRVALLEKPILLARYHSFRPAGCTKAVKGDDDVLLDTGDEPPWARLMGIYVATVADVEYTLARVKVFNLATRGQWIDTLTAAPHLTLEHVENSFVPATLIKQRILTCNDTREGYHNCLWVNWFLSWGPLKYPLKHFDEIWNEHNPYVNL